MSAARMRESLSKCDVGTMVESSKDRLTRRYNRARAAVGRSVRRAHADSGNQASELR